MTEVKTTRSNVFLASDWFDTHFFGDFLYGHFDVKAYLNDKKYKLSNQSISSRVLTHWNNVGLLPDSRPEGKGWRKFSFSELVWIRLMTKLRKFGLDLEKIKSVKDEICRYDKGSKTFKATLLDFYIIASIKTSYPIKAVVFESGEADIVTQDDLNFAHQAGTLSEDYISIDLNDIIGPMVEKEIKTTDYFNSMFQRKDSLGETLAAKVRKDGISSVTIKVKNTEFLINEEYFIKNRTDARRLIAMVEYGEISELKEGPSTKYRVTHKTKIKRDEP